MLLAANETFVFDTYLFKDPSRSIVVAYAFVNIGALFKRM